MIKKFDKVSKEAEKKAIDEIITRIEEIDDSLEVGIIAAQDIVDIVVENLGPEIYNLGLRDAKKQVQERFFDIESGIDLLEQR